MIGATGKDFDDLVCGKHAGLQPKTDYSEWFGDFKYTHLLSEQSKLVVAYYRASQHNVPRTHSTAFVKSWRGTSVGSDLQRNYDQERDLAYVQLHIKGVESFFQDARFSLSFQEQSEELRRQKSGKLTVSHTGFRVGTLGFWAEMRSKTPAGTLTYGGEYYTDTVSSYMKDKDKVTDLVTATRPRGTVSDDSSYDLAGVFVQSEKKLSAPLALTLGARYNYAKVDAGEVDPDPTDAYPFYSFAQSYDSVAGSLRLAWKAREDLNLICGVSQGFRAPNLSDTTSFEDVRTNSVDVPTPDLDAESSVNCEIGIKVKNERVRGELFCFYSMLSDFIRRVPTTYQGQQYADPPANTIRYYGKENFGKGHIEGVELKAACRIDKGWSVFGDFMWQEGKGDDLVNGVKDTTYLSRMAPTRGRMGFRWDSPERKYWFEAYSVVADKQEKLSPDDESDTSRIPPGGTPGYVTYNVRGGLKLSEELRVAAAVENITNVDYRIHGSGVNAPGTNFVISLELRF
jgi:hemoglobin/transferrin/lactoferrin receptor protein